jgi:hypothetical protein
MNHMLSIDVSGSETTIAPNKADLLPNSEAKTTNVPLKIPLASKLCQAMDIDLGRGI